VFYFHGSAGSRLEHPQDQTILADLCIRLISCDRPGHGLSDHYPDRAIMNWPEDVGELADHLEVERFHVMGWSAGGPYALACAHKLPERVQTGAVISGIAPPDRPRPYKGLRIPSRILMFVMRNSPGLVTHFRRAAHRAISRSSMELRESLTSSLPPEDKQLLLIPENLEMLVAGIREGYIQGWHGPARDDIIINRPWGFPLEDIPRRIDIWHGDLDLNVPLSHSLYQQDRIPDNRLWILPGQAHLGMLAYWREILEALIE
ncbi:MAG: alpha/beta fold hydrolase, partial [bacterium]